MADGFFEFLIGRWLGVRDERRRAAREAAGPQPPSAVERGVVRLLRRIASRSGRAEHAAAKIAARTAAEAAAVKAVADARAARRRRERLRRAKASARRRAVRRAKTIAARGLVVASVLAVLAIIGGLSRSEHHDRPGGTTTVTIKHRP